MILSDLEIENRISSPINLLNRLRNHTRESHDASNVYGIKDIIPAVDEKLATIQESSQASKSHKQIVSERALAVVEDTIDMLSQRLDEVSKPEKLAGIIRDMSQVIKNTEETKTENPTNVQFIFHAPRTKNESDFEVIDVT